MEFHAAYNYYCDESCHLKNDGKQYMILGYISAPYDRIKKLKEDIKELRKKYKNTLEVKWSNLNAWNYTFYADLVNFFSTAPIFDSEPLLLTRNDILQQSVITTTTAFIT